NRVRLIAVMPSILGLLGVSGPPSVQGRSVTPLLHDGYDGAAPEGAVSEYSDGRVYESLRRGGLAYIVDGPEERLFDLLRDPGESENVLAARPDEAAAMRGALERWRRDCRAPALRVGPHDAIDPAAPGVRFTVRVDERRVFSRVLNPQAHRHDRKWDDERIDLGPWAGREVTLELATDVDGRANRAAGTPGWSGVRLVQADERAR